MMKVLKFGGTSVGSGKNIQQVAGILKDLPSNVLSVVVVSAMGGVTDLLIEGSTLASKGDEDYLKVLKKIEKKHLDTIKEIIPVKQQSGAFSKTKMLLNDLEDIFRGVLLVRELSPKSLDYILGFGERLSSLIISCYLQGELKNIELVDPMKFIRTDKKFGNANVDYEVTNKLIEAYFNGRTGVQLCPGFIAATEENESTTLGRGGSDFTASIIAAALSAETLEIWTDVSGIMTSDPRLVKEAHPVHNISYEEAMELSHFGAKVIYPPSIQPAMDKSIPIWIKNTFAPGDYGTYISDNVESNGSLIKGISSVRNIALINLSGSGMVGIPSFSHRLFKALSEQKINVILITQASSEHTICVGIDQKDAEIAREAIENEFELELQFHKIDPVLIEKDLAIVALVGSGMKEQVGVSGKMFDTLSENGVSVKAIAQGSSERNISAVITQNNLVKAINSLHESFFLSDKKAVNLFIVGVGNVGGELIGQVLKQRKYLLDNEHIDLRIVGLANSKKMVFNAEGYKTNKWKEALQEGESMEIGAFIAKMKELNLRNSIFVDNTASYEISEYYKQILQATISVVTPNKVACASNYDNYLDLKKTAQRYKANFLYETNVGAGLPVISTLNDLIKSGDKIKKIQAVLSGSLNFIFNTYDEGLSFTDIVKQAQSEGYTEPDPRIDLSGVDVMRKILILIRESGYQMELEDIKSTPFIPEACMDASSVDEFFEKLPQFEHVFQEKLQRAKSKQKLLKYVATFDNGEASAGLQEVGKDLPFYQLEGKDNIVLFYTERYPEQPLVIKGAGAGASVTASGIFADIMRIANSN